MQLYQRMKYINNSHFLQVFHIGQSAPCHDVYHWNLLHSMASHALADSVLDKYMLFCFTISHSIHLAGAAGS